MKIIRIILLLTTALALISMLMPFRVEKPWESFSGDLRLINSFIGFDLFLPVFTLPVFLAVALYILFGNGSKFSKGLIVFVSVLNGLYMLLIYNEITTKAVRFPEPQVGAGFYLLCIAALVLIAVSIANYKSPDEHN